MNLSYREVSNSINRNHVSDHRHVIFGAPNDVNFCVLTSHPAVCTSLLPIKLVSFTCFNKSTVIGPLL
jgi:hypothetical protein